MIFGDNMGRMALASRWQNAACFDECSERRTTRRRCKGSNIFAMCHPIYRKSGLILFIFKLNSCCNDQKRILITDAE